MKKIIILLFAGLFTLGISSASGVPAANSYIPQWFYNAIANVAMWNAPANTRRVLVYGVSSTTGSASVTVNTTFQSSDVGKNVVITGLGPNVVQSLSIVTGGSGNAVGDLLTVATTGGTCSAPPVLKVVAISSGGVTAAVPWTPGSCVTKPSSPLSVASTTGSGSGSTFTPVWGALPLQAVIQAVAAPNGVTLSVTAQQTLSSATEWVAWGNDDAPAINLALASGTNAVLLGGSATYGIFSPLVPSTTTRTDFQCNGATIVALAAMAEMVNVGSPAGNFFASEGSTLERCRVDGMGVAALNVSHQSFAWSYQNNVFLNATIGNVYDGGYGENTKFGGNQYRNDTLVTGSCPRYNVSVNYTDNQFINEIGVCAVNNFVDNSSGNYWTSVHGYGSLASQFVFTGSGTRGSDLYADTVPANVPGFLLTGTYIRLMGWDATATSGSGAQGVSLSSINGNNIVMLGRYQNITNSNAVTYLWSLYQGTTNTVAFNGAATYVSTQPGGDGSFCFGLGVGCSGGADVAIGTFSQAGYHGVAIGLNNSAYGGGVALGAGANDNGANRLAYSSNDVRGIGFNQVEVGVLSGTLAAGVSTRLTSDGGTAGTSNTLNLPPSAASVGAYGRIIIVAFDYSNTKAAMFYVDGLLIIKGTAPGTTRIVGTPTITLAQADSSLTSAGLSTSSLVIAADTNNGGPSFTLMAPTGIPMRVTTASYDAAVQ